MTVEQPDSDYEFVEIKVSDLCAVIPGANSL